MRWGMIFKLSPTKRKSANCLKNIEVATTGLVLHGWEAPFSRGTQSVSSLKFWIRWTVGQHFCMVGLPTHRAVADRSMEVGPCKVTWWGRKRAALRTSWRRSTARGSPSNHADIDKCWHTESYHQQLTRTGTRHLGTLVVAHGVLLIITNK